jgi:amidophosphoribosyltransferase
MPVPETGIPSAVGFAEVSGIPYGEGFIKNRYIHRTFIKPSQRLRSLGVRMKLTPLREAIAGKRLVVVDDSIVRGTTTGPEIELLREAGAREIHLRISCPPIRHPCYFGVDFATREQLIAHNREIDQIRDFLGVDSLRFLSLEGMLSVMDHPAESWCTACYSGDYRIDIEHPVTDQVLARAQLAMFDEG